MRLPSAHSVDVTLEVFMATEIQVKVLWVVMPC